MNASWLPGARRALIGLGSAALVTALSASCSRSGDGDAPSRVKIAAAASLAGAFEDVARAFRDQTGQQVIIAPAASGKLAQQIMEGAPFDVFASADASWVDEVVAAGAADASTRTVYAYGRVVLWAPGRAATGLAMLHDESLGKIALASPEHAPYGRAARQALEKAGMWDGVKDRIVYGSNVQQALQFASTGNAGAALTALSLVIDGDDDFHLIDEDDHAPLAQEVVACKDAPNPAGARAFIEFLTSEQGRDILRRYGLVQKGETVARGSPGP